MKPDPNLQNTVVSVCILVQLVTFPSIGMGNTIPASETESFSVLRQNAPAIAHAIAADATLRSIVGEEKWPQALKRLAEFSNNTNGDCREALRIIGDTIPRARSRIGNIQLDGNPSEWSESIPPADGVRHKDRGEWAQGAAAVVRQDHLYLMVGVADAPQYFAQPDSELRLTIDCKGDQAWDVCLSLSLRDGSWVIKQMPVGADWSSAKPLATAQGFVGTVAEIDVAIRDFVPITEAKPIWTLYLEAKGKGPKGNAQRMKKQIPVLNENAQEGVAAWPYLRTFMCLCADKPLEGFELTAAAIAIMSSTMYLDSDEEVRQRIRVDNAEFLELARSIDAWQAEIGTEYRLKNYPLEAQLAWAERISHLHGFLESSRTPGKKNNLENYYWVSTSVETFRKLKVVAIQEGLTNVSLAQCSERIDKWVKAKEVFSYSPESYDGISARSKTPKEQKLLQEQKTRAEGLARNADVVGTYRGKPVLAFPITHSESQLGQIMKHGQFVGSCGPHTRLCVDFMRALGIAPLRFHAEYSREILGDHAWPARYDPVQNLWLAHQSGRRGKQWWNFSIHRPHVFSYATEAGPIAMSGYNGP
ncbi:MAG: hypothetical protein NTY01_16475, partial [Verrucomicrobia bacterium]|nr:hypothetical protein [Verrucomicrobiota bacterium]